MRSWQGWAVWSAALLAALLLPGKVWRGATPPPFPWEGVCLGLLAVLVLVGASLGSVLLLGPAISRSRTLTLLDAPPELLWAGLALALWPAAWGPQGVGTWTAAFLCAALPGEARWLAQALPEESPFPSAWGEQTRNQVRKKALLGLLPRWLAARVPVWVTATLVLERLLGVRGLGSDWMERLAFRDRTGLAAWVLALALLWAAARFFERRAR